MFPEFKNLKDVLRNYKDDQTCRQFLVHKRWNGTPICPHCGHSKCYTLNDNKTYKCANKECYKKFTVTVGTIFENTNIPLSTWFAACYIVTAHTKGISSVQLAKDLGITQKSAWFMVHRIREMLKEKCPEALEGIVEADETYLGRKFRSRFQGMTEEEAAELPATRKRNKGAVAGVMQREGKVRAKAFDSNSAVNVKGFIKENVKPGTRLMTDEAMIYRNGLDEYHRQSVNHSSKIFAKDDIHTNNVEAFWSVMKRGVYGTYHQISVKHLQRYCDEFTFRHNNRAKKDGEKFELALTQIEGRLTYQKLIEKNG